MAEPISCPSCQRLLNVPEAYHGQTVQCPDCSHQFIASPAGGGILAEPPPMTPAKAMDEEAETRRPRDRFDDNDRPMPRRAEMMPHRGSMIYTLGILSIFFAPFILGTIAWILGNSDLQAMKEGRMDPAGEEQTRTGRMIGKIMVIINVALLVVSVLAACVFFSLVILSAPQGRF